jgi:hypothetical protein
VKSGAWLLPVPYPHGHGEPGRPPVRIEGVWLVSAVASRPPPDVTLEDIVIIGVAAICVFVAVLVLMLRWSARRQPGPKHPGGRHGEGPAHG